MAAQAKIARNKEAQQQKRIGRTVLHKDMVYELKSDGKEETSVTQLAATVNFEQGDKK